MDKPTDLPPPIRRIPLLVKIAFTAFMGVLVPYYWKEWGPANFLYFCDVALFMTLIAVWTEKSIFASMPAVGILFPQALWCVDFLCGLGGIKFVGMTGYMFDSVNNSLFARGLSFFHFWLPFFLVYLIWRLGYDRKAFKCWTILAWILITICYVCFPAPPAPPENPKLIVNINYVYGLSDAAPQTWMSPRLWMMCLYVGLPILVYLPVHCLLSWKAPKVKF